VGDGLGDNHGMHAFIRASLMSGLGLSALVGVARAHDAAELRELAERHRLMAAAHAAAARCLESGRDHDLCLKELQESCKGLGIGRYCGLRVSR
jgi:hypothetical protein